MEKLMKKHQRIPGSIRTALMDRFKPLNLNDKSN